LGFPVAGDRRPAAMTALASHLICRTCGQNHRCPELRLGERAVCVRCGTGLRRRPWLSHRARQAVWLGGALFAGAAVLAPYVILGKFGREHVGSLADLGFGLWEFDRPVLAGWVWFCGVGAPVLLLVMRGIGLAHGPPAGGRWRRFVARIDLWSMPEVQVLGTLIAFFKLGAIVDVRVGSGLWCYAALALCLLVVGSGDPRETQGRDDAG
jgi:paraquat-inducible protein A